VKNLLPVHAGKGGVTMPAKGRLTQRDYEPAERAAIQAGAAALNLSLDQAARHRER